MKSLLDLLQEEKSLIDKINELSSEKKTITNDMELQSAWREVSACQDKISNYISNNITHDIYY